MEVVRKLTGGFAQKMTKNTGFTTNDRTGNTKLLLVRSFVVNLVFWQLFGANTQINFLKNRIFDFLIEGEYF